MQNIELNEFIRSTLVEVAQGVRKANEDLQKIHNNKNTAFSLSNSRRDATKGKGINFDIAISASNNQKDKAGFIVALASIGGGANTEKSKDSEIVHRINFDVAFNFDII